MNSINPATMLMGWTAGRKINHQKNVSIELDLTSDPLYAIFHTHTALMEIGEYGELVSSGYRVGLLCAAPDSSLSNIGTATLTGNHLEIVVTVPEPVEPQEEEV